MLTVGELLKQWQVEDAQRQPQEEGWLDARVVRLIEVLRDQVLVEKTWILPEGSIDDNAEALARRIALLTNT